jgi:hypothetical protein
MLVIIGLVPTQTEPLLLILSRTSGSVWTPIKYLFFVHPPQKYLFLVHDSTEYGVLLRVQYRVVDGVVSVALQIWLADRFSDFFEQAADSKS